jgi:hypothetical protein
LSAEEIGGADLLGLCGDFARGRGVMIEGFFSVRETRGQDVHAPFYGEAARCVLPLSRFFSPANAALDCGAQRVLRRSNYQVPILFKGASEKERIEAGEIGFTDWEVAKKEIRDRVFEVELIPAKARVSAVHPQR